MRTHTCSRVKNTVPVGLDNKHVEAEAAVISKGDRLVQLHVTNGLTRRSSAKHG